MGNVPTGEGVVRAPDWPPATGVDRSGWMEDAHRILERRRPTLTLRQLYEIKHDVLALYMRDWLDRPADDPETLAAAQDAAHRTLRHWREANPW